MFPETSLLLIVMRESALIGVLEPVVLDTAANPYFYERDVPYSVFHH